MVQRPLALHDDPVPSPFGLLQHPLDGPLDEVADDAVHGDAPAVDHHPGLAGGHERRGVALLERRLPELQRHGHLADRAVRPHRQDHPLAGPMGPPDRGLVALRRAPVVDDPHALRRGRRGELGVVAEEGVQPGVHIQAGVDGLEDLRPPVVRQPAARRRDADQEGVGRFRHGQRLAQRGDRRDVMSGQPLAHVPAGDGRVENRHGAIRRVADHAHRRLGVVRTELALRQDHEASAAGFAHGRAV
jgi:hypothetical protein